MLQAIGDIVTVFQDVAALFAQAPLNYLVAIMIVGAAVGMVGGLLGRKRRR